MIRQAHTYLVGALSGVVVIGIAIAAFIVLVSAQVFHDLPIPALSSSDQKVAVSQNKAVSSPDSGAVATGVGTPQRSQGNTNVNPTGGPNSPNGAAAPDDGHRHQANAGTRPRDATGPAEVVETVPSATTTSTGGDEGSSTGGGKSGSGNNPQPSSTTRSPSSPDNGSSGGGGNSNSSSGTSGGNSGPNSGTPTNTSGSSGGAPSTGTSGGGSTTALPATPVTTAKPSETVTEGVNGTVGTVDEALGGTLTETGATKVTEEVVEGVAGPESVVGKTVDGVGEVVGGLVGGNGQ